MTYAPPSGGAAILGRRKASITSGDTGFFGIRLTRFSSSIIFRFKSTGASSGLLNGKWAAVIENRYFNSSRITDHFNHINLANLRLRLGYQSSVVIAVKANVTAAMEYCYD